MSYNCPRIAAGFQLLNHKVAFKLKLTTSFGQIKETGRYEINFEQKRRVEIECGKYESLSVEVSLRGASAYMLDTISEPKTSKIRIHQCTSVYAQDGYMQARIDNTKTAGQYHIEKDQEASRPPPSKNSHRSIRLVKQGGMRVP